MGLAGPRERLGLGVGGQSGAGQGRGDRVCRAYSVYRV